MIAYEHIPPQPAESPSQYADRLGREYAATVNAADKKERGQFFTPLAVARYMAQMTSSLSAKMLHIADPGCGTGILSISLIEELALQSTELKVVDLVLYETDKEVLPYTEQALLYLQAWLRQYRIRLDYHVRQADFILQNAHCFGKAGLPFYTGADCLFDIIISNPPYFKIGKNDPRALAAKEIVHGQPNIYALFMMAAARLLSPAGQMVFIVPRSFASGHYFNHFRQLFLQEVGIRQMHLFASRTASFKKDKVLQELVILHGQQGLRPSGIMVSTSAGAGDLHAAMYKAHPYGDIVSSVASGQIIHLPISAEDTWVMALFQSWEGTLARHGLQISTGPVVSFRSKERLFLQWENHTVHLVPLFQLINTGKMSFEWPLVKKDKPQYINMDGAGASLLLPNRNYVFLRRFSTKDDSSRLVAAPYFAANYPYEWIGVENHLNYIYRPGTNMEEAEVVGLAALLNSRLFDTYFRTFNGNINVSATELRQMPLPPLALIHELGNILLQKDLYRDIDAIDRLIPIVLQLQPSIHKEYVQD